MAAGGASNVHAVEQQSLLQELEHAVPAHVARLNPWQPPLLIPRVGSEVLQAEILYVNRKLPSSVEPCTSFGTGYAPLQMGQPLALPRRLPETALVLAWCSLGKVGNICTLQ